MKHKIYKILFVFAILFANIAPAPAAMTLDEYWKNADADPDTSMWNLFLINSDETKILANIDCSTYNQNVCCSYLNTSILDNPNTAKQIAVDAYYAKGVTSREAAMLAQPTDCVYYSNLCFECKISLNEDEETGIKNISATCEESSNTNGEEISCPTPGSNLVYKHCTNWDQNDDKKIDDTTIILITCNEYTCPDLTTENNNNQCVCPNNADCSNIDDIKCLAGYYDSTPIGDTLTCTYCPEGSYCPGGTGTKSKILCPAGSYCPAGASAPITCAAGTYSTGGASQCTQCVPGTYCTAGASNPIHCPAGSYCPDGKNKKTCPTPWSLSALSAKSEQECYVTLAELQYIKDDKKLSDTTTDKCPEGYACPGGDVYYPNYGKVECQYNDPQEDSPTNITQWLKNICPLAQSTSAITDTRLTKSWKTGAICYADMILETTCGQIVTEAIPQATNGKYLTWDGTAETRPNAHYYKTITAGLYAKNLYTDTYCTSDPSHYQLYKNAIICPAGKYCKGYTTTPQCAGTNPTEYSPNGDVAGGYYSTGGADTDKPTGTGNGCLTGYKCGKTAVGYYSTGGGTTDEPTGSGENKGCLTNYTCGQCPPGINCPPGSTTNDNKCRAGYYCAPDEKQCPAGSTSDAGQSAITGCYIKGGNGGTGFCVNSKCFNIQTNVNYNNTPIPSN